MEAITQDPETVVRGSVGVVGRYDTPTFSHFTPGQAFLKRTTDIIGALVILLFFVPVGLVVGILVRFTSPGPLFFKQQRLGISRSTFAVYKLRSMYQNADEVLEEVLRADPALRAEYDRYHKLRNDPRVTPLGRVLRKFSLDEFPQLVNVLRGEMSLVGPRPYLPWEMHKMYNADIILRVRPGLTGPWQVSGRNHLSFKERLALDEDYVQNWSLWLDLHLIVRTIPMLLRGDGAS